ncbi:MAG: AIPR family protein [Chloroflexi bacterium]|nr:AIPR family protein [Chloroflexota bacterium]
MANVDISRALQAFRDHIDELAETWYEGDRAKAFRHAAFQQVAPDPLISDAQVIELTAIDKAGDLEVDGWFVDDTGEFVLLFQSVGGQNRVDEASVMKFWESAQQVLEAARVVASRNQSVRELSERLEERLRDGYNLRMVFASKAGFVPSASEFGNGKAHVDRVVTLSDGTRLTCRCSLELLDEGDIAQKFDDYRSGFRGEPTDVELTVEPNHSYEVERGGRRSLRATVLASEIVSIFRMPGMRFRLFSLNPRGPLASAKVNKGIARTLDSPTGRQVFHLLNNGLCATCSGFELKDGRLRAEKFQIVNGCQTTVTLDARRPEELTETMVDLKLAVADTALAESIAAASNAQTALRAKDYASFERQQRQLWFEFERLQPPWYYEIKQGYWRFVLSDAEKARFKTGRRKRHIEVQPLAQASLAFLGYPAEALDRVRFVFEGIRTPEERQAYERAFPADVRAEQLLLPWLLLDYLERQTEQRLRFSTFHVLWLVAALIKDYFGIGQSDYFSLETTDRLIDSRNDWLPSIARIAYNACNIAFKRAQNITGEQIDLRDFFRASGELSRGVNPLELLSQACKQELQIEVDNQRDPRRALPR